MKGWMRLANRGSRGAEEAGEEKRPSLHPAPNPFPRGGGVSPFSREGPSAELTDLGWYQNPLHTLTGVREGPLQVKGL